MASVAGANVIRKQNWPLKGATDSDETPPDEQDDAAVGAGELLLRSKPQINTQ